MKYSVHEFASEIRKLYPGDYDDLSDNKLVELWLKKYPKDIQKINVNQIGQSEIPLKTVDSLAIIKGLTKFLSVVFWAIILIIAFNSKPSFQDHKDTFLNEVLYPLVDEIGNEVGIADLSSINFLGVGIRDGIKEYLNNSQDLIFKDYYLFSIVESDSVPISFGAFGIVYIPPKVKDEMNKQVRSLLDGAKSLLSTKNELLNQFPECVRNLGKLMKPKYGHLPFIFVTKDNKTGDYIYPNGKVYNTTTKKYGTYQCDENGNVTYNFGIDQQTTQQLPKQPEQQNGIKYTEYNGEGDGVYRMGHYNPDVISKVQTYLGLKPTGYFDQSMQKKLEGLGYDRGFRENDVPYILYLTGYGKIDTGIGEIN